MIWRDRLHVGACKSTQLLLLDSGLPEGSVATADHQTAGRGRLGRAWVEAPGTSVLCSVLLRPPPGRPVQQLSLVAGLATAQAVDDVTGLAAQIKWPNDVLVGGRKVAGVLAEASGEAVVVGVGINVNQTEAELPPDARLPAASLRTLTGREHDREQVLSALLARLDACYEAWKAGGIASLHAELAARDFLLGCEVTVGEVKGIASGVDAEGRLLVGRQAVESGEVILS